MTLNALCGSNVFLYQKVLKNFYVDVSYYESPSQNIRQRVKLQKPIFRVKFILSQKIAVLAVFLVRCRNPRPLDVVMRDWLCRSRMGLATGPLTTIPSLSSCSRNNEGKENAVSRFRKLSQSYGIASIISCGYQHIATGYSQARFENGSMKAHSAYAAMPVVR